MCPPSESTRHAHEEAGPAFDKLPACIRETIPDHACCREAYDLAWTRLPASIFNHSLRVHLYARHIARIQGHSLNAHCLFVACILHDMGTVMYAERPERFEITGADVAVELLQAHADIDEAQRAAVWQSVALHTTTQIADRFGGMVSIVRLAIRVDFGAKGILSEAQMSLGADLDRAVAERLPRLAAEKDLSDRVVAQAEAVPEKAPPACWPGDLLRSKRENPTWTGVNKAF